MKDATPLARIDLRTGDTGPVLYGWTADNRIVAYPLSDGEIAALAKRLVTHLAHLHRDRHEKTAAPLAAAGDYPRHDGRPAA